MKWLELCVPFPVSASNFWVAANSMISPLNTGDVITEDVIVQALESDEDKTFFNENFPFRAPWHGQTQTPTAKQWIDMKTRTITIVTNEIIRIAMDCMQRYNPNWRPEHFKACHAEKSPGNHWFQNNQRPLIVGSDQGHVIQIVNKLIQAGVSPGDIICVVWKSFVEIPITKKPANACWSKVALWFFVTNVCHNFSILA